MSNPGVSIVIPSFNREELLGETILSVQKQLCQSWELIIVDDGSTDNALGVAQSFAKQDARILVCKRPEFVEKGANGCRNYGFTLSKGKYIKWLDSDDLLTPDALQKQVDILDREPSIQVCFAQGIFFDSATGVKQERWSRKIHSDNLLWDYIRNNVRWPVGGPLWRKQYFTSPPFDVKLKNSQEWLMHGLQVAVLDPAQYYMMEDIIYLIRRGNVRMSSNRNARYFFNQAKARAKLLKAVRLEQKYLRVYFELIKQISIYSGHGLVRSLANALKQK